MHARRPRADHAHRSRVAALVLAFAAAGCGYHFPGEGTALPGGGSRLHVARFDNRSRQPGVESQVVEGIELEIARRGRFTLAREEEAADLVLEGTIQSIETRPIAFSTSDETLQYETVMVLSAALRNPATNAVVWRVSALRENDSYGAVSDTVVPSSSAFVSQSTLNANNLNQLSDVQLSEAQRREALDRIVENTSRDLYNAIVEDF